AQVSGEAVLLGDSSHHFTGVRVSYRVATREIFQSLQLIPVGRYALSMTVSAPTANQLNQVLEQLQACLRWDAPPAAQ
ncbi:MAG TPA: hypothetical protein VM711_06525, partial [Sphingomicrobium sp.]|nr:hypothetical protein [Sphingomicrobium sp.]